jgi:hypothetical protein
VAISSSSESSGYFVEQGTKVYLMVYNNTAMDSTTELFLGTAGTWNTGAASDTQLDKPLNYRLSGITQPIFGGANSAPGGGIASAPSGSYQLQPATFEPIPEPTTIGLLGLLGLAAMRRGRRFR